MPYQLAVLSVIPVMPRLTYWPAVPLKGSRAFCPGRRLTVTVGPSMLIGVVTAEDRVGVLPVSAPAFTRTL